VWFHSLYFLEKYFLDVDSTISKPGLT